MTSAPKWQNRIKYAKYARHFTNLNEALVEKRKRSEEIGGKGKYNKRISNAARHSFNECAWIRFDSDRIFGAFVNVHYRFWFECLVKMIHSKKYKTNMIYLQTDSLCF